MKIFHIILPLTFLLILACSDAPKQGQSTEYPSRMEEETAIAEDRVPAKDDQIILFFGNSLSAGYGLKEGESFPDRIQEKIDSNNLNYTVVNAGYSGETTAGGVGRIDWVLNQPIDIFVLELGGNDILRGIRVENTYDNLKTIVEKVRAKDESIKIVLAGMQAPPNMGADYTEALAAVYPRLAKEYNLELIPFLLDKVGGNPELNQPDGIHPNIEGAKIVAATVWETIKDIL